MRNIFVFIMLTMNMMATARGQTETDPDSLIVRILEIYASPAAYQSHLQTPHFLAYKQSTLHMVKSLDLVDVKPMNAEGMWQIFRKLKR